MNDMWRYLRHCFTPGVCAKHALRKNYFVGVSLSGPYFVCPQCVTDLASATPGNSEGFIEEKRREMDALKIAVD